MCVSVGGAFRFYRKLESTTVTTVHLFYGSEQLVIIKNQNKINDMNYKKIQNENILLIIITTYLIIITHFLEHLFLIFPPIF